MLPQVDKAVACLVRRGERGAEVLVFDHPVAGTQLPKGTVEPGEPLADAALRELAEESGITDAFVVGKLGEWTRSTGPDEDGHPQQHLWHLMLLEPGSPPPERWRHGASGSPEEEALVFSFRWVPVADGLAEELHPVFSACAAMLDEEVG